MSGENLSTSDRERHISLGSATFSITLDDFVMNKGNFHLTIFFVFFLSIDLIDIANQSV